MDSLLDFILQLYRAAQDTPVDEFQTLALDMLKALVPFRSATWSNAGYREEGITARSMHLYNEPLSLIEDLVAMNSKHSTAVSIAARQPNTAHQFYTADLYAGPQHAEMRDYQQRYSHDKTLIITDNASRHSYGEWLSLYRAEEQDFFSEQNARILAALMPHLTEALTINRALTIQQAELGPSVTLNGARALVRLDGVTIHVGNRFAAMLREAWPDWQSTRLPQELLQGLMHQGHATIAKHTINITAASLGNLLLLSAKKVSALSRLSVRELTVVRLFGAGRSYKEIAKQLGLSPVTIRNYIQHGYRKLQIDNKVALARLLETEAV